MSGHHSIVKKGKDCIAIAKNALNDISSGREEMAIKQLSALQKDGNFLAEAANELAERLEAVDNHYQGKDEELLRQIGNLNGHARESAKEPTKRRTKSTNCSAKRIISVTMRADYLLQRAIFEMLNAKEEKLRKKKRTYK